MNDDHVENRTTWYRQFWPWFLLALPAAAVIGGILTFYLALRNPDRLIQRIEDERMGPVIFESEQITDEQRTE